MLFRTRASATQTAEELQRFVSDLGDTLRQAQVDLRDTLEKQMKIRDVRRTNKPQMKMRGAYDSFKTGTYRAVEGTREKAARRPLTVLLGALVTGIVVGRFFFNR